MDIFFALVGLAGFEGIRLLKRVFSDKPAIPDQVVIYLIALVLVAFFTAGIGYAMDMNSALKSIFVGFSVPSGAKAILNPHSKSNTGLEPSGYHNQTSTDDHTDDIKVSEASKGVHAVESQKSNAYLARTLVNTYFGD